MQRSTGDYRRAAGSFTQAMVLFHTEALGIARDIGLPLEEADALHGIGCCHIQAGDATAAGAFLRQALDIYRQIGSPRAKRLQKILNRPTA